MSNAIQGHGASFSIGGSTIGDIIRISGPAHTRDSIDISTMDSTNKFREFLPGMLDAGEVTLDLNYEGSSGGTSKILDDQYKASAAQAMIVTINDHTTPTSCSNWTCNGFITALGQEIPFDDKVVRSVTIKLTGEPTYTPKGA